MSHKELWLNYIDGVKLVTITNNIKQYNKEHDTNIIPQVLKSIERIERELAREKIRLINGKTGITLFYIRFPYLRCKLMKVRDTIKNIDDIFVKSISEEIIQKCNYMSEVTNSLYDYETSEYTEEERAHLDRLLSTSQESYEYY